eukprot:g8737.t1 g8737   contig33:113544-114422(+)
MVHSHNTAAASRLNNKKNAKHDNPSSPPSNGQKEYDAPNQDGNDDTNSVINNERTKKKPSSSDSYLVSRDVLQSKYPVFESFNGTMHSGLLPAAFVDDAMLFGVDDESGTKKDGAALAEEDYSSYFFWLFQPDGESGDRDEVESFRDDTLTKESQQPAKDSLRKNRSVTVNGAVSKTLLMSQQFTEFPTIGNSSNESVRDEGIEVDELSCVKEKEDEEAAAL